MRKQVEESTAAESARRATGAAAERDRKGRFSARRQRATVLRLLRGEGLESVSRALGITAARASHWRDQFLAAGQAGLKSRAPDTRDEEHQRLHAKVGERLMENELLYAKVDHLEAGGPLARRRSTRCVAPRRSPPVGRTAYTGSAACGDGRGPASTCDGPRRGRAPHGAAPDEVLVGHIRRVLEASPFHGAGYRKAWAKLRVERIRTSQERVRRLMREHGLQAPPRAGHAHGPKAHDGTITTAAPNVMWGTDMTSTVTVGEGAACVFVAVDHGTTEGIGLHAAKRGTRFEALEPIRQGVRERVGPISDGVARGLRLRHDHGSNDLADDFQQEVAFFGIESSPSFVREPEGHGVAERFIRT